MNELGNSLRNRLFKLFDFRQTISDNLLDESPQLHNCPTCWREKFSATGSRAAEGGQGARSKRQILSGPVTVDACDTAKIIEVLTQLKEQASQMQVRARVCVCVLADGAE